MVFRAKGAKTFKLRVVAPSGAEATLSTGCQLKSDADDVERIVKLWMGKSPRGRAAAQPAVLELVVSKAITLREAYELEISDDLGNWLTARDAATTAAASIVDLQPHVTAWRDAKAKSKKRGAASADTYMKQLRVLFPENAPFHLTHFTRKTVSDRLDALPVDTPTKNRYKAAISSFAKYLLKQELLETNFVRDIEGFGENDPRMVYYEREQAKALIGALEQPFAGIAAVACGFCAEWTALESLTAADLDLARGAERAFLRGEKFAHRTAWVPLVDENRWVLPYIKMALGAKVGRARVFPGISETQALRGIQKRARELEIVAQGEDEFSQHTLHDWRHTHVVQLLRDGYSEQIAAAHARHKNTDMIRKIYGRFIPTKADYAKPKATRVVPSKRSRR